MAKNFYEILGVEKTATSGEIKSAYLKLALKWHPDKNLDNKEEAEEKFKEISKVYETLSNVEEKNKYDSFTFVEKLYSDFDTQNLFERELNEWSVFGTREGSIHSFGGGIIGLADNDTKEYREAKSLIIENIKRTIKDWTICSVLTSPGQVDELLIHRSFEAKYDDCGYLEVVYGKVHWKKGFTKQEWAEITNSSVNLGYQTLIEYPQELKVWGKEQAKGFWNFFWKKKF